MNEDTLPRASARIDDLTNHDAVTRPCFEPEHWISRGPEVVAAKPDLIMEMMNGCDTGCPDFSNGLPAPYEVASRHRPILHMTV